MIINNLSVYHGYFFSNQSTLHQMLLLCALTLILFHSRTQNTADYVGENKIMYSIWLNIDLAQGFIHSTQFFHRFFISNRFQVSSAQSVKPPIQRILHVRKSYLFQYIVTVLYHIQMETSLLSPKQMCTFCEVNHRTENYLL